MESGEVYDSIISGVLHHDNYSKREAVLALNQLNKVFDSSLISPVQAILVDIILKAHHINMVKGTDLCPTAESLEVRLSSTMDSYMSDRKFDIIGFAKEEKLEANLSLESAYIAIKNRLFSRILDKYDECLAMKISSASLMDFIEALKEDMRKKLSRTLLSHSFKILEDGAYGDRGQFQIGYNDFRKFIDEKIKEMDNRFSDVEQDITKEFDFTDPLKSIEFRENSAPIRKLCQFGFKPIDDFFYIYSSDNIVMVGQEGIGKTNLAVHLTAKCLDSGHSVIMMTGESRLTKIWYMLVARYIHDTTGLKFTWKEIQNMESGGKPLSDKYKSVILAKEQEFSSRNAKVHLVKKFNYSTVASAIRDKVKNFTNEDFGLVILDHQDKLSDESTELYSKSKTDKQKVDHMYNQLIDIGDELDLATVVLAHTSADAEKNYLRGKDTGIRGSATSSAGSKDADVYVEISATPVMKKQGFLKLNFKKAREEPLTPAFIVKRGPCSTYSYSDEYQETGTEDDDIEDLIAY